MVARQTLTLFVRVRILLPQPFRGVAQLGRALRSGRRGRWFESSHLDQLSLAVGADGRKERRRVFCGALLRLQDFFFGERKDGCPSITSGRASVLFHSHF